MNVSNCTIHNVPFRRFEKNGKEWWSHSYTGSDGSTAWCNYKEGDQKRAEANTPAPAAKPATVWDDKDRRIQRQHSQEMALRWADILQRQGEIIDIDDIKPWTDHFMADLEPKTSVNTDETLTDKQISEFADLV